MDKDPEPAVDAIATWFSTMLENVGALTSRSTQIAGQGLCSIETIVLVGLADVDKSLGPSSKSPSYVAPRNNVVINDGLGVQAELRPGAQVWAGQCIDEIDTVRLNRVRGDQGIKTSKNGISPSYANRCSNNYAIGL